MKLYANLSREIGKRSPLIYGHFLEHFHRQIYGGVYDPSSPLADEDGFRVDVLNAMKKIKASIIRWPGGCFVSAYHWKDAVGDDRKPYFDKAWRVEEPNLFGTDEFVKMCRKIECEPYICTNAGTGTPEEMSDWVEYCNLETEGRFAKWRISNGYERPHGVKFWSVGNENYYSTEIGAKSVDEWGLLVKESAKMIKRVDPSVELSAAASGNDEWKFCLLKHAGKYLDWFSIHSYRDDLMQVNDCADYESCMVFTDNLSKFVDRTRGLLTFMGLEKQIKIAIDEWNLRTWHHPKFEDGLAKEDYLYPRDKNDDNSQYTMADAIYTACFLNMCLRNCDIVGMANFAPTVNTRGCIYTYPNGIVLRSTYHVFDLFVNYMGDVVLDSWADDMPKMYTENKKLGKSVYVDALDLLVTRYSDQEGFAISAVNKEMNKPLSFSPQLECDGRQMKIYTVCGITPDSYNDIDREEIMICEQNLGIYKKGMEIMLSPHSVNVIQFL